MRRACRVILVILSTLPASVSPAAAAGVAAAAPAPAPASAPAPALAPDAPARVRLATWNVAWLNRAEGQGHVRRSAADYDRLRRYAERIDADIVALQEVDGPVAARRLFHPSAWDVHLAGDDGNPQRAGFALRRGLPVTRHADVEGLALASLRAGADITVHLAGGDLRLLAVHLKSGCQQDNLYGDNAACSLLRRQLVALEAWIDARARESAAFAVVGDFNRRFEPPDRFWAAIDDADPPESDLLAVTEGRRPSCWDGRYPAFIDHIVLSRRAAEWLVRGSFRTVEYAAADARFETVLSDHCPIAVTLDSAQPPTAPPRLRPDEAAAHAGETATVCGRVAGASFARSIRGQPTFLNLDRPYPDQAFTVVIWGDDRPGFGRPESTLAGRAICVTGIIRMHRGRPEITVRRPAEITAAAAPGQAAGAER